VTSDPRIDAYIAKAQPFAQPILAHIRTIVHAACPEVEETIKWSMPFFDYKGRILGSMAAFKAHASMGLWRMGVDGPSKVSADGERDGMGQFGKLASVNDLPNDAALIALIHKAMAIIEEGPAPRKKKASRPELPIPAELAAALAEVPAAKATFDAFAPSNRYDYNEWIGEAKRPETRAQRVKQAIEWLADGKPRHWKYKR
jgi:uncharacterized protein YdeI (YjbR/CyaY-like superfamily)